MQFEITSMIQIEVSNNVPPHSCQKLSQTQERAFKLVSIELTKWETSCSDFFPKQGISEKRLAFRMTSFLIKT